MEKTNIVNMDQPMTLFGSKTPKTVIYKSESYKLHQAFTVKQGEIIVQGVPVSLTEKGQIKVYADGEVFLGIAVTDSVNPAYQGQGNFPVEVTVMVEGYALCNWVSNAEVKCGYVKPSTSRDLFNSRFVKADNADAETHFIAITPADKANELIQVLIR